MLLTTHFILQKAIFFYTKLLPFSSGLCFPFFISGEMRRRKKKFLSHYTDDKRKTDAHASSSSIQAPNGGEAFNRQGFFRLMVGNFRSFMKISPEFIRCIYRENVPPESIVLEPEIGEPMMVQTERRDQNWVLSRGWPEFVKEQRLEHGDFVHFSMIHKLRFEVFTLGMNGCPKHDKECYVKYLVEQDSSSDNSDEKDSCFEVTDKKKVSTFEISDDEEEANIDSCFEVIDKKKDSTFKISDDEKEANTDGATGAM